MNVTNCGLWIEFMVCNYDSCLFPNKKQPWQRSFSFIKDKVVFYSKNIYVFRIKTSRPSLTICAFYDVSRLPKDTNPSRKARSLHKKKYLKDFNPFGFLPFR